MRILTLIIAGAALLSACASPHPATSGDPDAVGTAVAVSTADDVRIEFAPDRGYEYFEGTEFVITADRADAVVDSSGATVPAADITAGQRIEVWVDACMESFPVQCPDPYIRALDD